MSTPTVRETGMILPGVAVFDDAAEVTARTPPEALLLVRYGKTTFTKGTEDGEYDFGPDDADKVLADFEKRDKDIVIDWEHQTLTGNKAPAAAWIKALVKTAEGVVGHVRYWTEKARESLKAGEYRYFSPVLHMSKRRPLSLHSVALTNHPATHGLPALVTTDDGDSHENDTTTIQEPTDMEHLTTVAEALGLSPLALDDGKPDEAGTTAAITARIAELLTVQTTQSEFLALHDAPDLDTITGKIRGMVPAAELTALNDRLALIDAEKAVAAAFTARKLVEAQRSWALDYAAKSPDGFAAYVASTGTVAPPAPGTVALADTAKPKTELVAMSDEEFEKRDDLKKEYLTAAAMRAYLKAQARGAIRNETRSETPTQE